MDLQAYQWRWICRLTSGGGFTFYRLTSGGGFTGLLVEVDLQAY